MDAQTRFHQAAAEPSLIAPSAPPIEASTFAAVILHYLSDTARSCDELEGARRKLQQHKLVRRLVQLAGRMHVPHRYEGSLQGRASDYELLIYSHLAVVVGRRRLSNVFLRDALAQAGSGHVFWQEYARGLAAVVNGHPYHAREVACGCGLEKYWLTYLDLMETITGGGDIGRALQSVNCSFSERNADLHISQDWFAVEGSARAKVTWDFRRDAILLAAETRWLHSMAESGSA